MKTLHTILALIAFLGLSGGVFAADELPKVELTYQEYKSDAIAQCDNENKPWGEYNSLVPIPQYAALRADAVNQQIERLKDLDTLPSEERERLVAELDVSRIGDFSGFKALEVARLQYRSTMNSVFACGVVESRLSILRDLRQKIDARFAATNSEIRQKLEAEMDRLQKQKDTMNCHTFAPEEVTLSRELINSSMRQYCHYRYYLSYLESELERNRSAVEQVEKEIGEGDGTKTPRTIGEWHESYRNYASALDKEIDRAESTLPRAIRAYQEMERAYPAHILLVMIYDDYIRLRKNLIRYTNASTQIYLKAFNAQDTNNR